MKKDTEETNLGDARERLLEEEPYKRDSNLEYESFVERIAEAVHDAEVHFGVPSGAIAEVYKDGGIQR